MASPEKYQALEDALYRKTAQAKEQTKIEKERGKIQSLEENQREILEAVKTKPQQEIQSILEDQKDYAGWAKMLGLEDELREKGILEEGSFEHKLFKAKESRFYNDYIRYMRGQRKIEAEYVQSRRASQLYEEFQKKGYQMPETFQEMKEFVEGLNEADSMLEEFGDSSREIFLARHLKQLKDYYKDNLEGSGEKGRITETPYMKKQMAEVEAAIIDGKPIFIHGHLGSGKTEMSLRAAYKYLKEYKTEEEIQGNIESSYQSWVKNHPKATDKEKTQIKSDIEKESRGAVVISGSKETTISDFTGHRTLNISDFEEKAKKMKLGEAEKEYQEWLEKQPDDIDESLKQMKYEGLLKVYLEKNGGTFSDFYIGPVYRAMTEGRPIIIDEVDAIPHDALIFLNHIMTRKPGDTIPVQGDSGERVTVKEGFSIILTGNYPKIDGGDLYVGRQDLDAAFLSRLVKLEHDYLPQTIEPAKDFDEMSQEELENSELFHVLVSGLINRNGGLRIPEGEEEKLWRLACYAKKVQDVFSGKISKIEGQSDDQEAREKLHKEVLSMRQLLTVIKEWKSTTALRHKNEGMMQYELDHYVLEHFIKRAPEEETKWELYRLAQQQFGLFNAEGWPDSQSALQNEASGGISPKFDIKSPKNKSGEMIDMRPDQVVQMCFGKAPEGNYPELENLEDGEQSDFESQVERQRRLDELEQEFEKLKRGEFDENFSPTLSQTYKTPEGKTETIEFNLEQQLERFNTFYTEENIETPDDFEKQIKKLWSENQQEIKQSIEQYGYDEILFIPPYDTEDINKKTTKDYSDTWQGSNFKSGGSFSGITDTKENKTRIVLIHKKDAENMQRPELKETKNKSIYDLCNAQTDAEKKQIDKLIKNKKPLPINGLTLGEYLIADRIYFKETGSHLDYGKRSWTWLPNSYSGNNVAVSCWDPDDSQIFVNALTPDFHNSVGGCRSSRTII